MALKRLLLAADDFKGGKIAGSMPLRLFFRLIKQEIWKREKKERNVALKRIK